MMRPSYSDVGWSLRLPGVLFCAVFSAIAWTVTPLPAASPSQPSVRTTVQRTSIDRDADLVRALISQGRFEDAKTVCQIQQRNHSKTSSAHALATARLTAVLMEQQIATGKFDAAAVATACEPVDQLLRSYPDHPRSLFLKESKLSASRTAIQMAVAVAAVNLNDQSNGLSVMSRLTRLTRDTESLMDQIRQTRAQSSEADDSIVAQDLDRLEQDLLVAVVSMSLLQTELFPPDSTDAIAAATATIEAAIAAGEKLPRDSLAANEIQRMEITAKLRSGDPTLAFQQLERLLNQSKTKPTSPLLALQVEILLALDQVSDVAALLRGYEQIGSTGGPASIHMDLAKLLFHLHTNDLSAASVWIIELEERHGVYARRRGEAIAISKLDRVETQDAGLSADSDLSPVALIETRGRELIRSGDFEAGARLLARAARSSMGPDRTFPNAMTAAAAFQKAGLTAEASRVLIEISTHHPDASNAAPVHLQAIVLLTQGTSSIATETIQTHLRQHLQLWPDSESTDTAAKWLIRILDSQGRMLESARVSSVVARARQTPQWIETMEEKWSAVFLNSDSFDEDLRISRQAMEAILPDQSVPKIAVATRSMAAAFFDPRVLDRLPKKSADEFDWVDPILCFRRNHATAVSVEDLKVMDRRVRRRLIRDGQRDRSVRKSVAALLLKWQPAETQPSEESMPTEPAIIQLWMGNVDAAIKWVEDWRRNEGSAADLSQVATLFQSVSAKSANAYSIQLWDRLAAGSQIGSRRWHQAKLAAIRALHQSGEHAEASRRARYILLPTNNLSDQQRGMYQDLVR